MLNYRVALILIIAVFSTGCASLSTYQTAKTLEPGEKTIGFAISQSTISVGIEDAAGFGESVTYAVPEAFFRVGIKESLDLGIKVYPIAGLIDVKYQFLSQPSFDAAVDLGISYMKLSLGNDSSEIKFIDFYPSILLTYHFTSGISATLTPKIIVRSVSEDNKKSEKFIIPGSTLTFAFGNPVKGFSVMPEIGIYTIDGFVFTNIGVGLSW